MFVSVDFDHLRANYQHYQTLCFQVSSTRPSISTGSIDPQSGNTLHFTWGEVMRSIRSSSIEL